MDKYFVNILVLLVSRVALGYGFYVYDSCDNVGVVFCMGMKGNKSSFENYGCIKDKNCEVILRAENFKTGHQKVSWSLISPSRSSVIRAVLAPASKYEGLIVSDSVNAPNFKPGTFYLQGQKDKVTTHFINNDGRIRNLLTQEVKLAIWPESYVVDQQSNDKNLGTQKFTAYFFKSDKKIQLFLDGQTAFTFNLEESLYPSLMHWGPSGLMNKAVSFARNDNNPVGFRIFAETPWDPKKPPPDLIEVTTGAGIPIPPGGDGADIQLSKKNKAAKLTWLWVLIGILGLIGIGLAIFFFVRSRKKNPPKQKRMATKKRTTIQKEPTEKIPIELYSEYSI